MSELWWWLLAFAILLIILEYQPSRYARMRKKVLDSARTVDLHTDPNVEGCIHAQVDNLIYQSFHDSETNITLRSPRIELKFYYCQLVERRYYVSYGDFGYCTTEVSKEWCTEQQTQDLGDGATNPQIPTYTPLSVQTNVTAGGRNNLTISRELFESAPTERYVLTRKEIRAFKQSRLARDGFVYIGNGYFYRPYAGGLNMLPFGVTQYTDIRKLLDNANPGDICAKYCVFPPRSVISVVAWKQGNVLRPIPENFGLGSSLAAGGVAPGSRTAKEIMRMWESTFKRHNLLNAILLLLYTWLFFELNPHPKYVLRSTVLTHISVHYLMSRELFGGPVWDMCRWIYELIYDVLTGKDSPNNPLDE